MRSLKLFLTAAGLLIAVGLLITAASSAHAQGASALPTPTATATPFVAAPFTEGFGNDRVLTFSYLQQFECVHQFYEDLNFNGIAAQTDPGEFQTPVCEVADLQIAAAPPGALSNQVYPVFALIPMFSVNNDTNPNDAIACNPALPAGTLCGPALGGALISIFKVLPEAFKESPLVAVQCPNTNTPTAQGPYSSPPGTCTMHSARLDLGVLLHALGVTTSPSSFLVPEPNLTHLIGTTSAVTGRPLSSTTKDIAPRWWQVWPVLVSDPTLWPPANGSSGITSYKRLKEAAESKPPGATILPSNYFLFFSSAPAPGLGKTQ